MKSQVFNWNDMEFILSRINDVEQDDESKILNYLRNGKVCAASASIIFDCFSPNKRIGTCLYSDGDWEWNDAAIYYVEKYHFKLKKDFINHMRDKNRTIQDI